ncbi:FHIPEP family type III secretion protein [bacterium]|nr:FHIPEP family type III secretion protein [bacterium]
MAEPSDPPEVDPESVKAKLAREEAREEAAEEEAEESEDPRPPEPVKRRGSRPSQAAVEESFSIHFGSNLYPLNQAMIRQVLWLGKMMFARSGLLLPPLQLTPNAHQSPNLYAVNFLSQEVGRFAVPHQAFLVLGEEAELRNIEPVAALNPHPLTGERMVWVFWGALQKVYNHDLFPISHLEFMAYFTNWLFHKNYVAFFTVQRCQQSLLALTEHVPTLAPLRGFFLKEVNNIWRFCLELLRSGGSLRNFPRILHEYHRQRSREPHQSIHECSRAIIHRLQGQWEPIEESPADLSSPEFRRLASGLIYMHASQAGWSEQLANRLTEAEINQLLQTLMEISGGTPGARIPLTQEVISRLDAVFMGRTPQDYFEFLRQLLDGKSLDSAPLNAVDRFALLMLSLPEGYAPDPEALDFLRAPEKKALLGRVAFLTFHQYYGTFEHGPPTKHLMDIRDQVLVDFLDSVSQPGEMMGAPPAALEDLLNHWAMVTPHRFVYLLLRHYYYVLDPMTRLGEAAKANPRRVHRALRRYFLSYAKGGEQVTARLAPWRRGSFVLAALTAENKKVIVTLLEAQGAWIRRCEPPTSEQKTVALQEFARRFWPYRSPVDATFRWQ